MLWRFDLLSTPALAQQAVSDARAADLVVVSGSGHDDWPPAVEVWLERWEAAAAGQDAGGLVALLLRSGVQARTDRHRFARLEQLAYRCGRDFLAKEIDVERLGRDLLFKKIHDLARQTTSLMQANRCRSATSRR
jgi:hypothetical protein